MVSTRSTYCMFFFPEIILAIVASVPQRSQDKLRPPKYVCTNHLMLCYLCQILNVLVWHTVSKRPSWNKYWMRNTYEGFFSLNIPKISCQNNQCWTNLDVPNRTTKLNVAHINKMNGHPFDWTINRVNKLPRTLTENLVLRHKKSTTITWNNWAPLKVRVWRTWPKEKYIT